MPKCEIVNSARAIAVGMHCAAMRASSIPEKVVSASGRAACVYLPDYTIAQFVGEVRPAPRRSAALRRARSTRGVPAERRGPSAEVAGMRGGSCVCCGLPACDEGGGFGVGWGWGMLFSMRRVWVLCVAWPPAQVLGFPGPLDRSKFGFGPYTIPETQVFFATPSSLAFVNIRPVTQGHVLVAPRRRVARFADMGPGSCVRLGVCSWLRCARVGLCVAVCGFLCCVCCVLVEGLGVGWV
jgi:hypothetical protein